MASNHKIIDLFCGAGGLSLGAHFAGFTTALAVDKDPILTSSYCENFPRSKLFLIDIKDVSGKILREKAELKKSDAFGLIGGPPCQGFSLMGHRNVEDPRNTLIGHFFRLVGETKPEFFLMENVPGILLGDVRRLLDNALSDLKGYTVLGPITVDACDFGAATRRQRVIVIGLRAGKITEEMINAEKTTKRSTVRCAIKDLPEPTPEGWGTYRRLKTISEYAAKSRLLHNALGAPLLKQKLQAGRVSGLQPTQHTDEVRKRFASVLAGKTDSISRCPRLSWDDLAPTLRAGTGPDRGSFQSIRPIHPRSDRVITVREAARLQGFPDWFKFHDTKWHSFRMIGNSVSPLMSEGLLKVLSSVLHT